MDLRHRLGLSQVAFARRLGISRNTLIGYERGDRLPRGAILARRAETGQVSIDWLLNGQVRPAPASDPEWDVTVRALRDVWRDRVRRVARSHAGGRLRGY